MIRSETVTVVGYAPTAVHLAKVYGFAWNALRGTFPATQHLMAFIVYGDGRSDVLNVRPGVWYASGRAAFREVRFYTANTAGAVLGAAVVVEASYDFDAAALPAPQPSAPTPPSGQVIASWVGYQGTGVAGQGANFKAVTIPPGTKALLWLARCRTYLSATSLTGAWRMKFSGGTLDTHQFTFGGKVADAGAGYRVASIWGGGEGAALDSNDAVARNAQGDANAIDALPAAGGTTALYKTPLMPPGVAFPSSEHIGLAHELGLHDGAANNVWDVEVRALG